MDVSENEVTRKRIEELSEANHQSAHRKAKKSRVRGPDYVGRHERGQDEVRHHHTARDQALWA
eukprot:4756046-Heterocapsa_arctica.AAC.1